MDNPELTELLISELQCIALKYRKLGMSECEIAFSFHWEEGNCLLRIHGKEALNDKEIQ